ncbi:hypothetical protein BDQ94DRAFT_138288 [Aspergillus welwitschiae]|uniref:Uncharacterized protein n=1 Tax=Aspergillus welwitschiae TaxID=1341132 RepID=A0A3F3QC21_9EURO|nr:hypothetical protein BDQ94DRAFT_138288 [Aspergillus welwitschiae]RDH36675.1 hypothetical protein BDQ94DRAFT_138288 [Aspergillus welwitschiae]
MPGSLTKAAPALSSFFYFILFLFYSIFFPTRRSHCWCTFVSLFLIFFLVLTSYHLPEFDYGDGRCFGKREGTCENLSPQQTARLNYFVHTTSPRLPAGNIFPLQCVASGK